jgi:hypothetical protein
MTSCKTCRFWLLNEPGHPEAEIGECRLNPPVNCPYEEGAEPQWAFPMTFGTFWCGKFEERKQ